MLDKSAQLEALLFFKGEPVKKKKLTELLDITGPELQEAIAALEESLKTRGLRLIEKEDVVELRTAPEASELIEHITKEELHKDLGKAGLETLSIILYKAPVAKRDIDYIRGVNSSFILRNLMIRGLIERKTDPKDARSYVYAPTTDLLAHLGIQRLEELPEYGKVEEEIENFYNHEKESETTTGETAE